MFILYLYKNDIFDIYGFSFVGEQTRLELELETG